MYYLTEKRKISELKRIETERRLTEREYIDLMMEQDENLRTIHKTRYCLIDNNQYFEIDIYPEWDNQAIMEIELKDEDDEIKVPDFIKIHSEVTEDVRYKNYEMARSMPKQLILKKK